MQIKIYTRTNAHTKLNVEQVCEHAEMKATGRKQKLNFKGFSALQYDVIREYVIFCPTVFPICLHKENCVINESFWSRRESGRCACACVCAWYVRFTANVAIGIVFTLYLKRLALAARHGCRHRRTSLFHRQIEIIFGCCVFLRTGKY